VAKILLIGLPCETYDQLERVLVAHEHIVVAPAEPADAVFCGARTLTRDGVRQVVAAHRPAPVIVVADQPNTGECFDALDHGAANYCSEPLEESEVLWTLAGALRGFETCAAHITEP
jgi:DNA-binding NarL/FixJ family response regulator